MGVLRRIRNAFRRSQVQADIEEEMRTHHEMALESERLSGVAPDAAQRAVRLRFGNRLLVQQNAYEAEVFLLPEKVQRHAHQAIRELRRSPGFSLLSVITLALGIGTTTAILTLAYDLMLKPLPFRRPQQIVTIQEKVAEWSNLSPVLPVSANHFAFWQRWNRSFQALALMQEGASPVGAAADHPELTGVLSATPGLFPVLGVTPAIGRTFSEEEAAPGREHVAILLDSVWRHQFGADPQVLGKTIRLSGAPYAVIGVMPPSFHMPDINAAGSLGVADKALPLGLIVPLTFSAKRLAEQMGDLNYFGLGRLRDDVSVKQATADLNALQHTISLGLPADQKSTLSIAIKPFQQELIGDNRASILLLLSAVAGLLFVSCVNIANLLLARAVGRQAQIAVASSLGAGRGEVIQMAFREIAVLAIAGGLLGMALAAALIPFMQSFLLASLAFRGTLALGWQGILACAVLTAFSALLAGVAPAVMAFRIKPQAILSGEARLASEPRGSRTMRRVLVGVEVAISIVLLLMTGLLTASMLKLMRVPRGYSTAHTMTATVRLPKEQYPDDQHRARFFREALTRLEGLSGVQQAAITSVLPLAGDTWGDSAQVLGDARPIMELPTERFRWVSPQYAAALQLPVRSGHFFSEDDWGRNVAVVSAKTAETLWPGRNPIGLQFRRAGSDDPQDREPFTVVGVVANARTISLSDPDPMMIYVPYWYRCDEGAGLLVRAQENAEATAAMMTRTLWSVDRDVSIANVQPFGRVIDSSIAGQRFVFDLALLFAVSSLSLAALGVYSVVNYSVTQRRKEIGLRMALGASRQSLYRLVLREGLVPVVLGIAVGMIVALILARLAQAFLFEVSPYDPTIASLTAAILLLVGIVACISPARSTAVGDPMQALRVG